MQEKESILDESTSQYKKLSPFLSNNSKESTKQSPFQIDQEKNLVTRHFNSKKENNFNKKKEVIENPLDPSKGSFSLDIPYKILGYTSEDSEIKFLISWKAREDSTVPKTSYVTSNDLKRNNYSSLLFDYYAFSFKKLVMIEKIMLNDYDFINGK